MSILFPRAKTKIPQMAYQSYLRNLTVETVPGHVLQHFYKNETVQPK